MIIIASGEGGKRSVERTKEKLTFWCLISILKKYLYVPQNLKIKEKSTIYLKQIWQNTNICLFWVIFVEYFLEIFLASLLFNS